MLGMSQRVRRSNFSYKVMGTKLRVYPTPSVNSGSTKELYIRVGYNPDPMSPAFTDNTIEGVSNLSNIPFGNLIYGRINSIGRQWARQYTLALSKELLGLIRSKFGSIPIPGAELTLNGADLIAQGREEQTELKTEIKEMLETMTYSAMLEDEAAAAENLTRILKMIPMPNGKAIIVG